MHDNHDIDMRRSSNQLSAYCQERGVTSKHWDEQEFVERGRLGRMASRLVGTPGDTGEGAYAP